MQNVANQDSRLTFVPICTPDVHNVTNVQAGWRFDALCTSTDARKRSEARKTPFQCLSLTFGGAANPAGRSLEAPFAADM
jgi:hypothetical protein